MEYKDYYKTLGLERTATQDEVKRAYRKIARKFHPDVNKDAGADEKFKAAGEAYEVLKDPEKRVAYDQLGENWQAGQDFSAPPGWDSGFEHSGNRASEAEQADFSAFFEDLFGRQQGSGPSQGRRQEYHAHGQDHHAKIGIDLKDAYEGAARDFVLRSPEVDPEGHVRLKERTIRVQIPKGVSQGQHIRLAGQGTPGIGEGRPGDLYLEIEINPDPVFRTEGRDVYLDLPISPWEAALGARVKMPTPVSTVDVRIPKNARSGQKLRLKGRGIPGKAAGNLYAVLQIAVPPADSEKARQLYEQMAQEIEFDPRAKLGV